MAAFQSHCPMKNILRLTLLFIAVVLIGDVTLRQLPEKILADLPSVSARAAAARPTPSIAVPTAARATTLADHARTPEEIATAGRIVTFNTQNLRDRLAIAGIIRPTAH